MQSLLLKLQADVEARKRPRSEWLPSLRGALLAVFGLLLAFQLGTRAGTPDAWADPADWRARFLAHDRSFASTRGEIDLQRAYIERLERIYKHSAKYHISADLAAAIEDIALSERLDPKLAFELVRVESEFNARAVSPVGAVGYTQLMPSTARLLAPGVTRQKMFDRETNLRLGFRFLRSMIVKYDGDVRLALLAYNRGPERVDSLLRQGVDPENGYAKRILGK